MGEPCGEPSANGVFVGAAYPLKKNDSLAADTQTFHQFAKPIKRERLGPIAQSRLRIWMAR